MLVMRFSHCLVFSWFVMPKHVVVGTRRHQRHAGHCPVASGGQDLLHGQQGGAVSAGIVKVLAGQGDKIDLEQLVQKAIENMEGDVLKSYTAMPFLRAYGLAEKDGKLRVFTVPKVVHMLARWLGMDAPVCSRAVHELTMLLLDFLCFSCDLMLRDSAA